MAQQQQQPLQQPRLQDLITLDALKPVVEALGQDTVGISDSEIPEVLHTFAGVFANERALAEAKVYVLNTFARNIKEPCAAGPYPTPGMEAWLKNVRVQCKCSGV